MLFEYKTVISIHGKIENIPKAIQCLWRRAYSGIVWVGGAIADGRFKTIG
jgi:hypothetical protein